MYPQIYEILINIAAFSFRCIWLYLKFRLKIDTEQCWWYTNRSAVSWVVASSSEERSVPNFRGVEIWMQRWSREMMKISLEKFDWKSDPGIPPSLRVRPSDLCRASCLMLNRRTVPGRVLMGTNGSCWLGRCWHWACYYSWFHANWVFSPGLQKVGQKGWKQKNKARGLNGFVISKRQFYFSWGWTTNQRDMFRYPCVTSDNYRDPDWKGNGVMSFTLPVVAQELPPFLQVEYSDVVATYLQQFVFSYSLPLCLGETSK